MFTSLSWFQYHLTFLLHFFSYLCLSFNKNYFKFNLFYSKFNTHWILNFVPPVISALLTLRCFPFETKMVSNRYSFYFLLPDLQMYLHLQISLLYQILILPYALRSINYSLYLDSSTSLSMKNIFKNEIHKI